VSYNVSLDFRGMFDEDPMPTLKTDHVAARLRRYASVELPMEVRHLPSSERAALLKLVEAASYMNGIYWKQINEDSLGLWKGLRAADETVNEEVLRLLSINFGPWDLLDNNRPFVGTREKPRGCNFYPRDLTKTEFLTYIQAHPELKPDFQKPTTLVRRDESGLLFTVPYEKEYQKELKAAARLLVEASRVTENASLSRYLAARARDLVGGDFYQSDKAWLALQDCLIDIVIGPIEVYDDELLGLKASYEAIVLVKDLTATAEMKYFETQLVDLERNLPVPRAYRNERVRLNSPIEIFDVVYASGMANAGSKPIAASLPNDERVKEKAGTKQLIYKNVLLAKFDRIVLPISKELIATEEHQYVTGRAFVLCTLFHELSHSLGPNYVSNSTGNSNVTVQVALEDLYSTIEEAKAEIVGIYSASFFQQQGVLTDHQVMECYVTYVASALRVVRFGLSNDHARANAVALSHLMTHKAVLFDPRTGKLRVEFEKMASAVESLTQQLLMIEAEGNYRAAKELIDPSAESGNWVRHLLHQRLENLPVDVEFRFASELESLMSDDSYGLSSEPTFRNRFSNR
jgi:hypothetical protein